MLSNHRYVALLAVLFAVLWSVLAIAPLHRDDWALENALVAVLVIVMAVTYRHFRLSRLSYTLIFVFLCVHEIGAHYTYSEVPYDAWFQSLTGYSLNAMMGWQRNHFDRLGHLLYGLLLVYPVREVLLRVAGLRGFWSYFFPLDFIVASSALYEMFEWAAAEFFGGDLGVAYLGTQGDVWDAQRDMALAFMGAVVTILLTAIIAACNRRDAVQTWKIGSTNR